MAEPTVLTRWRPATTLAVTWGCLVGAAFVALFARSDTDDYAGWALVLLAAQVAPAIGLARDRSRPHPGWLTAISLSVAAAAAAAWGLFMIVAMLLAAARDARAVGPIELGLLGLGAVVGATWAVSMPFFLRRAPHPAAAQRGLGAVSLIGLATLLVTTAVQGGPAWGAVLVMAALPLAWAAPLLLWLRLVRPRPVPAGPEARLVRG